MTDEREPQNWLGYKPPFQTEGQPQPVVPQARSSSVRRRWTGVGLVAAGLVAGGVMAGTLGASAATGSTSSPTASYSTSSATSSSAPDTDPAGEHGHGHGLDLSGTVTAVGTSSITIKTSTATTTYAVSSSSDFDKNGESQLSKLAVGDAVTFSTTTSGSTVTIDKLHAGNETLDRPQESSTSG